MSYTLPTTNSLVPTVFAVVNSVTTTLPVPAVLGPLVGLANLVPALPSTIYAVQTLPTTLGLGGVESALINNLVSVAAGLAAPLDNAVIALASGQTPVFGLPQLNTSWL